MEKIIQVLLIGEPGCGKTCLARALHEKERKIPSPTIGIDFLQTSHKYHNETITLKTWEISINQIAMLEGMHQEFDYIFLCTNCEVRKYHQLMKVYRFLSLTSGRNSIFIFVGCKVDILCTLSPLEFHSFLESLEKKTKGLSIPKILTSAETDFFINECRNMIFDSNINKNPIRFSILKMVKEFKERNGIIDN